MLHISLKKTFLLPCPVHQLCCDFATICTTPSVEEKEMEQCSAMVARGVIVQATSHAVSPCAHLIPWQWLICNL